jgi:DNA-directed RNA polymerase subunit M/transcription elongation factor TFIIS
MEVNFCEKCEYITDYVINDGKLYHDCKTCGHKKEILEKSTSIYETVNESFDVSEIINANDYKTHDITLPKITKSTTVKCIDPNCDSHKDPNSKITYFKYDGTNMKYMYICDICGNSWKNSK